MKKRIVSLLLVLVLILGTLPSAASAAEVTEVSDQAGLAGMTSGSYMLTQDITLSGWTELDGFTGTLDGNGHTITLSGTPLFNVLKGTVKNLILDGEVIRTANGNTGAFAREGNSAAVIHNCISSADVTFSGTSTWSYIGGFVGSANKITITNSLMIGTVNPGPSTLYGAICSGYSDPAISNCVAIGAYIAQIEGYPSNKVLTGTNCTLLADVSAYDPNTYVDSFNANRGDGLEWEVKDGALKLKTASADNTPATQDELDALTAAITAAENADTTKVYTSDSWDAFTTALTKAKSAAAADTKTQTAVTSATTALTEAQAALAERSLEAVDLTGKDVISITTQSDLESMVAGNYYRLDADLSLSSWYGYFFDEMNCVLDGNGHTITLNGVPLWASIGPNGVIQNLGIKGTAQFSTNDTGAIAQKCSGLIINCWSQTAVNSAGQNGNIKNTGGFVANLQSGGAIVNSYVSGAVSAAGNTGEGKVGALAGATEANSIVKNGYWLSTAAETVVGDGNCIATGCATKTRAEFYSDTFLQLLNDGADANCMEWNLNADGWPHLGEPAYFQKPEDVQLLYTPYEGYGEGSTSFTSTSGLILSLADAMPNGSVEGNNFIGTLSIPSYDGEITWNPQYGANGQGGHKVYVGSDGVLEVLGAGSLVVTAYDEDWNALADFTITVSNITAEALRLVPTGKYVTADGDGTYSVAGSGSVAVNTEIKVDGKWKSAPSSLFTFTNDGAVFGTNSSVFYATEPGDITVTVAGLEQTASVTVTSTYVPVERITPAPSGTYVIHGRDANTDSSQYFLDLTLSHGAGDVVVEPENASYRTSWTMESSDPTIAEYIKDFVRGVQPYKAGTVTLTATAKTLEDETPVSGTSTVTLEYLNPVSKVEISDTTLTVKENETIELPLTFTGPKSAEGYHVSEPAMVWSFSGDGAVGIVRDPLGVIVGQEDSKEYCIANDQYKLVGESYGTVTVTGTPVDQTGGAKPITFTVTVEPGTPEIPADTDKIISEGIAGAAEYLQDTYANWQYQYGDEWVVFILTRAGEELADAEIEYYLDSVVDAYTNPGAEELKPTTIARVILGVSVLGADAANLEGLDLVELLCKSDAINSGSNESMWALIALDSCGYEVPTGAAWNRDALIEEVLTYQNEESGGFGLQSSQSEDIDITAMAIQALAPYYADEADVKAAVDAALVFLRGKMDRNCDFGSSEATAQVLIALAALEQDALDADNGFVKSVARNLITALDGYAFGDGGYKHLMTDTKSNTMGTTQVMMALEAYRRYAEEENALYELTAGETEDIPQPPASEKPSDDPQQPTTSEKPADTANPGTGEEIRLLAPIVGVLVSMLGLMVFTPKKKEM